VERPFQGRRFAAPARYRLLRSGHAAGATDAVTEIAAMRTCGRQLMYVGRPFQGRRLAIRPRRDGSLQATPAGRGGPVGNRTVPAGGYQTLRHWSGV